MAEENKPTVPEKGMSELNRLGIAMVPVTGVPLNDWRSWARIGVYSLSAYATYKKHKKASYVFMALAAVSLTSSVTSGVYNKGITLKQG